MRYNLLPNFSQHIVNDSNIISNEGINDTIIYNKFYYLATCNFC